MEYRVVGVTFIYDAVMLSMYVATISKSGMNNSSECFFLIL